MAPRPVRTRALRKYGRKDYQTRDPYLDCARSYLDISWSLCDDSSTWHSCDKMLRVTLRKDRLDLDTAKASREISRHHRHYLPLSARLLRHCSLLLLFFSLLPTTTPLCRTNIKLTTPLCLKLDSNLLHAGTRSTLGPKMQMRPENSSARLPIADHSPEALLY